MLEEAEESSAGLESDNELTGSVGDGPVVGAAMRVLRNDGELLTEFTSDIAANYNITVKTKGKYYPLTVEATDGIDMVTLLPPDFRMLSAVLDPGKKTVSNINPFTTIALEMASDMPDGQTTGNIKFAMDVIVTQLNSGLDTLTSTGPMNASIDASNIAEIIKASETLGETVRRTRDALLAVGQPATGDIVVSSLGSDLTDLVVDGIGGPRADARISAVSTIAAAQTALESMRNQLRVNGSDATDLMSAVIDHVLADTPQITLAELVVTDQLLRQARIGVVAAELISPSSEVTVLRQAMSNVQPGMLPSAVDAILPRSASQLLDNALLAIAAGDDALLNTVNNIARNGGAVPADNRTPTIAGSPASKISVGASYEFVPDASDPNGDALTYAISGKPVWATFESLTGKLSGIPGSGDVGSSSNIVIGVSDGELSAALPSFSIMVEAIATNSPPLISGTAPSAVAVGSSYQFKPVASDPDDNALTFSVNNKPAWASFSTSSGQLAGTPNSGDDGDYNNIIITATDGMDSASLAPFSIAVVTGNAPPQISGSPATSVVVDSEYMFVPISTDPDGDLLTFSIAGSPSWASFDTTSGRIAGTPGAGDVGIHGGIVITVSDGEYSTSLGPFEITVDTIALGSVTLSWMPPTENDDGSALTDLAGYKIYWGTTSGTYTNSVSIDNSGITTYMIENLAPGTYEFVSTAFNAAGVESGYSNPATKIVP
jgi:hypothetical protein